MKKSLITLAVLVMSAAFALTGAGQAQADGGGGLCWNGWLWSACVQGPGWVDWNPGWNGDWDDGWNNGGHGHGHGHDD